MQLGIHVGQLSKYEQDRTVPGGDVLASFAATGVNLNWLLTGQGAVRAQGPELAAAPAAAAPEGHRYESRLQAVLGMLGGMPEHEAAVLIDEFTARASTQQQLAELKQAVQQLGAARAPGGAVAGDTPSAPPPPDQTIVRRLAALSDSLRAL
jgi:transcriptional regulator with XRE-family HTH domain